jgi:hypothetical protein
VDRRRPNQNTPAIVNVIANAETAGSSQDDALGWIRDRELGLNRNGADRQSCLIIGERSPIDGGWIGLNAPALLDFHTPP